MARGYNRLPLAAALLATATSASAAGGIQAGDWTLDIGGIVNAYYTTTSYSGSNAGSGPLGQQSGTAANKTNITTGLLPNYLIVSGKTRQNDLDVAFTISIQPGAQTMSAGGLGSLNQRQAFLTFGDASWGSIKLGKDLGIYASDAILNDMTLLGVGSNAGMASAGNTTLGRIGSGYIYADWKSQVAYTTPNFNGFNATVGVTQAWNTIDGVTADQSGRGGSQPAFEGKASYSWAGDVAGKVWASAISQKMQAFDNTSSAVDVGANVNFSGLGLTAYYNQGQGMGSATQFGGGGGYAGYVTGTKQRLDSTDWYLQATYVLPTTTKVGISYGESKIDHSAALKGENTNSMWTVGAYHPLTKHLNLVAEYSDVQNESTGTTVSTGNARTVSAGAILFF